MTWHEFLSAAQQANVRFARDGNELVLRGPRGRIPTELICAARAHKADLLRVLDAQFLEAEAVGEREAIRWEGCLTAEEQRQALARYAELSGKVVCDDHYPPLKIGNLTKP